MAESTGGEHRVQITPRGGRQVKVTAPEKRLNGFVHFVALLERVGNALGTLAFTWATVVLLGGYPTVLRPDDDFWFATTIVFIEAARYRYAAASLLRNMCTHAQSELSNSDLKELSYILREVLELIMDAEGAELEVLIGLSSQICKVIPEDFARELEYGQIMERFVKRLVNALNANIKPTAHCLGIRRVIVEQAIYMMECNSSYANCFNKWWMMEALSMVEHTPSRAENYRFFLGDAGLMEHSIPLSALVARAKELMGREWLRGISSVT